MRVTLGRFEGRRQDHPAIDYLRCGQSQLCVNCGAALAEMLDCSRPPHFRRLLLQQVSKQRGDG